MSLDVPCLLRELRCFLFLFHHVPIHHIVASRLFDLPALRQFDLPSCPLQRLFRPIPRRLDGSIRFRIDAVHHHVYVEVFRIALQRPQRLTTLEVQLMQRDLYGFVHLLRCRDLHLTP